MRKSCKIFLCKLDTIIEKGELAGVRRMVNGVVTGTKIDSVTCRECCKNDSLSRIDSKQSTTILTITRQNFYIIPGTRMNFRATGKMFSPYPSDSS